MSNVGFLPYGSNDPSVVFKDPLTSEITSVNNSAWSFVTQIGGGTSVIHDPVLGMKGADSSGVDKCYRFTTMGAVLDGIENEGQISIEIERDWVCVDDPARGSYGDTVAANEAALTSLATSGPTTALTILGNSISDGIRCTVPTDIATEFCNKDFRNHIIRAAAQAKVYTPGKSRFVTVNIGWKGGYQWVAVDGLIINAIDSRNAEDWVNIWDNFYIGSARGIAGRFVLNHWMRNLQIANKAPSFSTNYPNRQIGVLSDSIFDDEVISAATAGDVSARFRIQRKFNKIGMDVNIEISENSGHRIYDTGALHLQDFVSTVIADKPNKVLIHGGVNDAFYSVDVAIISSADFLAAYKSIIEEIMGEGIYSETEVEETYLLNIIPMRGVQNNANYVGYAATAERFREQIDTLPAWWDSTYPARTGSVKIIDVFGGLGKETEDLGSDLYKGTLDGTGLDVHLAASGMRIFGDVIADNL